MSLFSWWLRAGRSSRRGRPAARLCLERLEDRCTPSATFNMFPVPTTFANPAGIATGSDGNLWFTENSVGAAKIGRITPSGVITEFNVPTFNANPDGITSGSDGNLWFAETTGNKIGRITTLGGTTEFNVPTSPAQPDGITAGPDGALFFTETQANKIGRITTQGAVFEFPIPSSGAQPAGIATGSDGNLWFTESATDRIGRMTTQGAPAEFLLPLPNEQPLGITAGPDGALWFTEFNSNRIGRITTSGAVQEFLIPSAVRSSSGSETSGPRGITAGPDGALYFVETLTGKIGRITTSGAVSEFSIPSVTTTNGNVGVTGFFMQDITRGPDNALWFTETGNDAIGRLSFSAPTVNVGGNGTAVGGQAFTRTGTFFGDPLNYTASVNYGDGTGLQTAPISGNTFALQHTFAAAGTFTVTVTVSNGFASSTSSFVVQVSAPVPAAPPSIPFQRTAPGFFAVGVGAGAPAVVNVFNAQTGAFAYQLQPFGSFSGGVRVAVGQLNGQDVIICAAGPGGFPLVQVYRAIDATLLSQFVAFGIGFTGGLNVAAGDLNGDGNSEIIIGADASPSGFPLVAVYDMNGNVISPYILAFDVGFTGGVRVAVGAGAGGLPDIVTGAGPGGFPLVQIIDGRSFTRKGPAFTVFDPSFSGGIYVAAGDLNGDGVLDVVAGTDASPLGLPLVNVHTPSGVQESPNIFAFDQGFTGGVRVAVVDLTGAGLDIVAGAGPNGFPLLQAIDGRSFVRKGPAFVAFNDGTTLGLYPAGDQL
jgi:streptogramin lyase